MLVTSYGGKITFGWEFESGDLGILDWYEPAVPAADWPATASARQSWVKAKQDARKWGQEHKLHWGQFQRSAAAPAFLAPILEQEIFDKTWEISPASTAIAESILGLFNQLDTVRAKFPRPANDQAKGFQVHIAFEAPNGSPADSAYWHARIAALYRLLNDYASLKAYQNGSDMIGNPFTGAATENTERLVQKLNQGASIESQDDAGAWVGKYKYHKVGLRREVYGDDGKRLGLEIRSGWKADWGRFRSLVERVVLALQNLDSTHSIKRNQPDGAAHFYLDQHLDFCRTAPLIAPETVQFLEDAAKILVGRRYRDADDKRPKLPYVDADVNDKTTYLSAAQKVVFKRWMTAFMPWEAHPAMSNDLAKRRTIADERARLEAEIAAFNARNAGKGVKKRDDIANIDNYFRNFFTATQIQKYL